MKKLEELLSQATLPRLLLRSAILILFVAYLLWELYWYLRVGRAFVRWHTFIIPIFVPSFLWLAFREPRTAPARIALPRIQISSAHLYLSLYALIIALLIAELMVRLSGICYQPQERMDHGEYVSLYTPQYHGWYHLSAPDLPPVTRSNGEFKTTHYTNAEGFIDRPWTLRKPKPQRVLFLGDSFTEGVGATGDSSAVRLFERYSDTIDAMCCGVSGSDPFFEYRVFHDRLLRYRPDCAFMIINVSDIYDVIARGGFERFRSDSTLRFRDAPWWEPLYHYSHLVRLYVQNGLRLNMLFLTQEQNAHAELIAAMRIDDCMDQFQALCTAHHVRCIFVFNPTQWDFVLPEPGCRHLIDHSLAHHYETVDLYEFFKQNGVTKANRSDYFWPKDGHNKSKGYALFARAMYTAYLKPYSLTR